MISRVISCHSSSRFFRSIVTAYSKPRTACSMSGDSKCLKIGTHNGTFHCDEVLACYMLKLLPQYKDAEIVRTRDPSVIDTCDIVVDVGGVFDPTKHRYDHHQRSFNETVHSLCPEKSWTTRLSSAGLVYVHFGRSLLAQILEEPADSSTTGLVFDLVYENLIEEIDAVDNGVNQYDGTPRYKVTTTLSRRVGELNPSWNQTGIDEMDRFRQAMEIVGQVFQDRVLYFKNSWLPARDLVLQAVNSRQEVDSSGEIISLSTGGCPWKEHLFNIEKEQEIAPPIKYVLYTDQSGMWRIQCVPVHSASFENRLSLPKDWQGLRDQELSDKSGIPGCTFVHANGFIGGNKTYDGIIQMARHSLKQST